MFKPFYGKCIDCGKTSRLIVVKRECCGSCNEQSKRLRKGDRLGVSESEGINLPADDGLLPSCMDPKKTRTIFGIGKRKSPIKVVKKVTGEWAVFLEIWRERKHKCQCCPQELGDDPLPVFFSHILSKGAYVFYRLTKLNIMLMCPTCHHEWEFGDKSQEKFKLARMIAEKLKRMYYAKDGTTTGHDDIGGSEEITS